MNIEESPIDDEERWDSIKNNSPAVIGSRHRGL